jgi:3D (Asp-Asp-Asp) domain-containing protein
MDLLKRLAVLVLGVAAAGGSLWALCAGGGQDGPPLAVVGSRALARLDSPRILPVSVPLAVAPPQAHDEVETLALPDPAATEALPPPQVGGETTVPLRASPIETPHRPQPRPAAEAAHKPPAPPGKVARTVRMRVTAYCPCAICCGRQTGITASGKPVSTNGAKIAAASDVRLLSAEAAVSVKGYNGGRPVPVIDRMAAGDGPRLDVFFWSHERAQEWGVRWMDVTVFTPSK